jgi:glycosyltransferase involved in cell wall biosynthesis
MLGHLHDGKDHATLVRAWAIVLGRLKESDRHAVLLLAGRPSGTEDAVKALAFDLELGRSVRFLGDVSDVGGLLAATDIAVLSSPSESAPHAVLESMSVGLPIAATDIPGIRQVVGVMQFPYLAPPGDAERLADAMFTLASDPDLRHELGERNRSVVEERVTVPAAEATAAALAAALAERARG